MPKVLITGGGTGGHLYPMVAIADALVEAGVASGDIRLVGSSRGEDRRIFAGTPYRVSLWPGRGIRRAFSLRATLANLRALSGIAVSLVYGVMTALIWKPSVVVSVGGYASLPMSLGAVVARRKLVLVELDAATGLAQRLVLRFCTARCTAFANTDPRAIFTGAPIRSTLARTTEPARSAAKRSETPPIDVSKKVVLVMTGSLGAKRVNDAVLELAALWHDRTDVVLIHITGRRDFERVKELTPKGTLDYRVVEFADMSRMWPVADIAICRAGATTVAELAVVGVPAILVPLPHSPSDHQGQNARLLADSGAAIVIGDHHVSGETLRSALEPLFENSLRDTMSRAMGEMGKPNATRDIAGVLMKVSAS